MLYRDIGHFLTKVLHFYTGRLYTFHARSDFVIQSFRTHFNHGLYLSYSNLGHDQTLVVRCISKIRTHSQ